MNTNKIIVINKKKYIIVISIQVMKFCPDSWLLQVLINEKHRMDLIKKKVSDYLETKNFVTL